jgi:alginate O-acetyltransferase complex protein AlgI
MVCADNLKEATALIEPARFEGLSSLTLLALLYGFSFQIFADFAGYSLIAMGLARLFGYQFCINFNFPYLSASLTEFWTRWHISLSTWLRDYLYIPLGGNRRGAGRTYVNLFLVMFLGGLWHGAAWSYAVWGTAHGNRAGHRTCAARPRRETALRRGRERTAPVDRGVRDVQRRLAALAALQAARFRRCDRLRARTRPRDGRHPAANRLSAGDFFRTGRAVSFLGRGGPLRQRFQVRFGAGAVRWLEGSLLAVLLFLILTNSGSPGAFIYFQF